MRVFLTQQIDNSEELHAQFMQVKSELDGVRKAAADVEEQLKELEKGMQAAKGKVRWMEEENEVVEVKCKDVERKRDQLKKKMERL